MRAGPSRLTSDVYPFLYHSSSTEGDAAGSMRRVRRIESRQSSAQSSLTLDPKVISTVPEARLGNDIPRDFATSLVSPNNFINYCVTVSLPLTNGKQIETGSCNPAPMGVIPAVDRIPSLKFQFPVNGGFVGKNQPFTIQLAVNGGLATGNFANSRTNYQAAPQQLDSNGAIIGYTTIAIESMTALNQTTTPNPVIFDFFKAIPSPAANGVLTATIDNGLAEGVYRLSTVAKGSNSQSIVLPVLQHGAIDDAIYFTVTADGKAPTAAKRSTFTNNLVLPRQTGNTTTSTSDSAAQNSTTLLGSQIATGFSGDGQDPPTTGQVASLTSVNNFINHCLTVNKVLTNGQQMGGGSCNPIPIGAIPAQTAIPSFKFRSPKNFDKLDPGKSFSIELNFANMALSMTDPEIRYLSAPQRLENNGTIRGYARVVIEALTSLNQTSLTDPSKIAFSASMNSVAGNGALQADVTKGLPAGFYRLSSIALTENHYPVALPVVQLGATNDVIYFQVGDGGSGSTAANSISAVAGPTPTSTSPSGSGTSGNDDNSKGVSPAVLGAAVGGSLGGVALIALILFIVFFSRRRRARQNESAAFDIPQAAYPIPFENGPHMGTLVPFTNTTPPPAPGRNDRLGVGEKNGMMSLGNPSSTTGSSSRRLSMVSVAPSYHTVAP